MDQKTRWWAKANAYSDGWAQQFPTLGPAGAGNVALGLAVAEGETLCGDAWPGECNWGAVQKRALTLDEKRILTIMGIVADGKPDTLARARDALKDQATDEALHQDSSPITGHYFVYFWRFPSDAEGAQKFIQVLAAQRTSCKMTLMDAGSVKIDGGWAMQASAYDLATKMYQTHYFEGFHDPHQPGGAKANIDDYAALIMRHLPVIAEALVGWTPGAVPPTVRVDPTSFDLTTTLGMQQALNLVLEANGITLPTTHLVEDGIMGPKTEGAVKWYQALIGIPMTGVVDDELRDSLKNEMDELAKHLPQ